MISIRNSISALEKCEKLRLQLQDCYTYALKCMAEYAIELEEALTQPYRKYVNILADQVREATPDVLDESRATLRGLLRDYRDRASQYLNGLRDELAETAKSLQQIVESLSQSDNDHDVQLRQAVKTLRELSKSRLGEEARPQILQAAQIIGQSMDELRKQHQGTILQFQSEIRVLHKRIDALETAAAIDNLTKLFNRDAIEERIASTDLGACVLLMKVLGLRRAEHEFGSQVSKELAAAFTRRLRNCVPLSALLGRCGEEEFLALLPPEKPEAMTAAKWITENLSGAYCCILNGKTVRPSIQVNTIVVERSPGKDAGAALTHLREFLKS